MMNRPSLWLAGIAFALAAGCVKETSIPDPEPIVAAYTAAIAQGDADAIYEMMSDESRRTLSREELQRAFAEQRQELADHAKALESPERVTNAQAELRYPDGEIVSLDLVDGEFRVTAVDALPAAARSPAQALGQLRRVLARRSYAGLLQVLSPRTRSALENDMRSLVEGLDEPEALEIEVVGDSATDIVPGGHEVRLRREDGIWRVDDFD